MAAYRVGTDPEGKRGWWALWQTGGCDPIGYANIRDCTGEEKTLMDKVMWVQESPADVAELRRLISQ